MDYPWNYLLWLTLYYPLIGEFDKTPQAAGRRKGT
jgi:hypothetical protein